MVRLRWAPLAVLALLFVACTRADRAAGAKGDAPPADAGAFRGIVVTPPRTKPDFTLTDFDGKPFDFRKETEGKVALLFFGYTHCPDVCPLHVANVAAVRKRLTFEEREAIRFIFVSTDPKRDTAARLKEWLGSFDPSFVGLRGSEEEVNRILYALQLPPIEKDPKPVDSARYLVGHAAQVLAFGTDGVARVEYPFGVRQEDWAHDLPLLVRGVAPTVAPADSAAGAASVELKAMAESAAARAMRGMTIRVAAAVIPQPATTSEGALYLVLHNEGTVDDTLTTVWSELAEKSEVHETMQGSGGMSHMMPVAHVVVKAGATLRLVPGGMHVMLMKLSRKPAVGDGVPVRLRFARAGDLSIAADVVPYADVEGRLRVP